LAAAPRAPPPVASGAPARSPHGIHRPQDRADVLRILHFVQHDDERRRIGREFCVAVKRLDVGPALVHASVSRSSASRHHTPDAHPLI
jgi:hypothetical protein